MYAKYMLPNSIYRTVGMLGRVDVWQIVKSKVVGKKFLANGYIYSAIRIIIISKIWVVLVWQITDRLPNSSNFPAVKHSCYTEIHTHVASCIHTYTTKNFYCKISLNPAQAKNHL